MNSKTNSIALHGCIDTHDLKMEWAEAPWDTAVFGFPVLQISRMEVSGAGASLDMADFVAARDSCRSGLVSCRLPHEFLRESMLLEDVGFRFIELVYQPELYGCDVSVDCTEAEICPSLATIAELPAVLEIAGSAFRNERFHVDPRLPSSIGDLRYQNWVRSAIDHATQRLYVLKESGRIFAFFVLEMQSDRTCYWHLNAVAPEVQGKGYGRKAWVAMLKWALTQGARCVRTSIVARNVRVLNLYARLGFRFPTPLMTFHWVRQE